MKLDYIELIKQKRESVSIALFGASVLFAVLIFIRATVFFTASANAESLAKKAVARSKPDAKEVERHVAKSRAVAEGLKKKNLFAPPSPRQHPVKQVSGILGDEVLIGNKWYKVGDRVADAKIVAIGPAQVKIEWDGKERFFDPMSAAAAAANPALKLSVNRQVAQKSAEVRSVVALPGGRVGRLLTLAPPGKTEAPLGLVLKEGKEGKEGRASSGSIRNIITLRGANPINMPEDGLITQTDPGNMSDSTLVIRLEKED
jgi:hypothetical protein